MPFTLNAYLATIHFSSHY